jgi:hypothetical protein
MEITRPDNSRKFLYCRVQTEVNVKMSKPKHETNEERRSQYQICGDPPNTNWKLTNQLFIGKNTLCHAVLHGESNCCRIPPKK